MNRRMWLTACLCVFGFFGVVSLACAKDQFPTKPVEFITGFSPGGGFDTAARVIARTAKTMGMTIVVENMRGAGGRRAISYTARSKPDGYTIVIANMPVQLFYNELGKDRFKLTDFSWIAQAVTQDGLVAVKEDSKLKGVNDLKKLSRFRLCFGGFAAHDGLLALAMQKALGYKHPQYVTGFVSSKAIPGLLNGECDVAIGLTNPLWTEAVKAKQIRVLAVFAPKRNPSFPNAPTFGEIGYPNLSLPALVNHGLVAAPPGTPSEAVSVLERVVIKAMSDPKAKETLEKNGITPAPLGAAAVKKLIQQSKELVREYGPLMAPYIR